MRALGYIGCLLVGLAVGTMGAFVQAQRQVFGVSDLVVAIPWGALLVLLALVVTIRGAWWVVGSRWSALLVVAGWLAATLGFALESGSGDLAISAGARQWGYVIGGAMLGAAACSLPPPPRLGG
jgi:hypothetical protein